VRHNSAPPPEYFQTPDHLLFAGWYPHPELNRDQRFRKPFQALHDYTKNMHDNRTAAPAERRMHGVRQDAVEADEEQWEQCREEFGKSG
jgi:hypothetical protein